MNTERQDWRRRMGATGQRNKRILEVTSLLGWVLLPIITAVLRRRPEIAQTAAASLSAKRDQAAEAIARTAATIGKRVRSLR